MSPARALVLQRAIGNQAVARRLAEDEHVPGDSRHDPVSPGELLDQALRSPDHPIPVSDRRELEPFHQTDLSRGRFHTGPAAQRAVAAVGARAVTIGAHVLFAAGADKDKDTLGHEAKHLSDYFNGVSVTGKDTGAGVPVTDPGQQSERAATADGAAFDAGIRQAPSLAAQRALAPDGAAADQLAVQRAPQYNQHQTTPTLLDADDSEYSSEDDFTRVSGRLPLPTPYDQVAAAVEAGQRRTVILYRGDVMSRLRQVATAGTAGGRTGNAHVGAPSQSAARQQVAYGRSSVEYTSDIVVARRFSRGERSGVIVVEINTMYLARGSVNEQGWVADDRAPVRVLDLLRRNPPNRGQSAFSNANAS
jgi:hypothetical protein